MTRVVSLRKLRHVLLVVVLVLASAGGWWGLQVWTQTRAENAFETAWSALKTEGNVRPAQEFAVQYDSDPKYQNHSRLLAAAASLKMGDHAEAYRRLSRVDRKPPLRERLLLLTGECLYHDGQVANAERFFRTAADENPDCLEAHRWLANIYHEIGAMVGALGELDQVVRLTPNDYRGYMLAGQIHLFDMREPKSAAGLLRKALELNPPEQAAGPIRENLARALLNHNDFKGALAALEPLPESVSILVLRAECQWSLGEKESARQLHARAQELSPEDRPARYLEARWLIEQREPDRAIEILESLLDVDPHEHLVRYQLALAYRLKGDVAASEKELARMQDSRKKRERLLVLYEKSMREPTNVQAREEIVTLLEELGKPELASVWRRAVAAVRPVPSAAE